MPAWALAAALAVVYLVADPPSADLAAQSYRAGLFEREGFVLWDNAWYAGHHIPGYSLLFPPLAAWLSPQLVGALAAVVAAAAFERLVDGRLPGSRVAAYWFAAGTATLLLTGRLTFALGVALALGAALAASRDRTTAAIALALATSAASPVAGAFLALAAVAWAIGGGPRAAAAGIAVAAVLPALVLAALFPEGGSFPFEPDSFWPALAATLLVLALVRREHRVLVAGTVLYAVALVASFALETPMGGNAVRLGALLAGPLVAAVLLPARPRVLLLVAPALLYWQWVAPIDDVRRASSDPSVEAAYYDGVKRFLTTRGGEPFRVEVPFTDNHWEAAHLAGGPDPVHLARGWERQVDRRHNRLFYDGRPLTARRYRDWLDVNAVRYVALHDAPMDYSAATEAKLIRAGLPYLTQAYADDHWRVFEVRDATPLVEGGRTVALGTDSVTVDAERPTVRLRVRWSRHWRASTGCAVRDGDWTRIDGARGRIILRTDFTLRRRGC